MKVYMHFCNNYNYMKCNTLNIVARKIEVALLDFGP